MNASAPTLHDVAREAQVSLATASRVLNGSTRTVAEAYRERVEAAAAKLGYTANLSAQATAKGTSAIIALLVADIADPYFGQIAAGVARRADEAGVVVTIAVTDRDPKREVRLLHELRGQRPRGVILAASRAAGDDTTDADLRALGAAGTRVVALGAGGDAARWIAVDNRGGASTLASEMAARGYRRAVIVAGGEGLRTSDERVAGFTASFTAQGGEVIDVARGAFSRDGGFDSMSRVLTQGITAETLVFAVSDVIAIGAMAAIRAAGRTIGGDIAVCGFDDIPTSADVSPALTTVRVPLDELGYEAAMATLEDDWDGPVQTLDLTVVTRESTPEITPS